METPGGNLSEIMRHINGAYTTYFSFKRNRSDHLMQGRYKAILIEADAYAKELSRYIHQEASKFRKNRRSWPSIGKIKGSDYLLASAFDK